MVWWWKRGASRPPARGAGLAFTLACTLASTLALAAAGALAAEPAAAPPAGAESYIVLKIGQPTARIEIWEHPSRHWPARYFTLHGDADGLAVQKVDAGAGFVIRAVQTRFGEHSIFGSRFVIPGDGPILKTRPGAATYFGDAVVFPRGGNGPPIAMTVHRGDLEEVTALVRAHHPEIAGPILTACDPDSGAGDVADCR